MEVSNTSESERINNSEFLRTFPQLMPQGSTKKLSRHSQVQRANEERQAEQRRRQHGWLKQWVWDCAPGAVGC